MNAPSEHRADATLIFNPAAGTGDPDARRREVCEAVDRSGVRCVLVETSEEKGAGPLAREAVERGGERVIVSGGDGSVAEAAEALAGSSAALAVLPAGTANLLALNAGIPLDQDDALHLALHGEPLPYDVGRANGRIFLVVVGMGADAHAVREADRETKDRLGPLAYILAAARNAARPRVRYRLEIDGRRITRKARTVLIANAGQLPGQAAFVPNADPRDGWLDVAIVRARTLTDVVIIGVQMLRGRRPDRQRMEIHRGKRIVLETDAARPVQLDGDEHDPCTRLEVVIEPAALNLVHPKPGALDINNEGSPLAPLAIGKPLLVAFAALILIIPIMLERRPCKP